MAQAVPSLPPAEEEAIINELEDRMEALIAELNEDIPGEVNLRANLRKIQALERTLGRSDTHPMVLAKPGFLDQLQAAKRDSLAEICGGAARVPLLSTRRRLKTGHNFDLLAVQKHV